MKYCPYCDKRYNSRDEAMTCARSHEPEDIVTISFLREDYQRLFMYVMLGERELITEKLYNKMARFYKK